MALRPGPAGVLRGRPGLPPRRRRRAAGRRTARRRPGVAGSAAHGGPVRHHPAGEPGRAGARPRRPGRYASWICRPQPPATTGDPPAEGAPAMSSSVPPPPESVIPPEAAAPVSPVSVTVGAVEHSVDFCPPPAARPRGLAGGPVRGGCRSTGPPHLGTNVMQTAAFLLARAARDRLGVRADLRFGALDNAPYETRVCPRTGTAYTRSYHHAPRPGRDRRPGETVLRRPVRRAHRADRGAVHGRDVHPAAGVPRLPRGVPRLARPVGGSCAGRWRRPAGGCRSVSPAPRAAGCRSPASTPNSSTRTPGGPGSPPSASTTDGTRSTYGPTAGPWLGLDHPAPQPGQGAAGRPGMRRCPSS